VASRYPNHPKGLDALLKVGLTYYNLNNKKAAYATLSRLKNDYPAYPEMNLVDRYLRLLQ